MDNYANQKEQEWVQLEIPGLMEQLPKVRDSNKNKSPG